MPKQTYTYQLNEYYFDTPCSVLNKNKIINKSENRAEFIIQNVNQEDVIVVLVDGCVIKSGIRCDWLFIRTSKNHCYFVELKGSDLSHAIEQLGTSIQTINSTNGYMKKDFHETFAYAITSRCPLSAVEIQNLKIIFKRKYRANLFVKNRSETVKFD